MSDLMFQLMPSGGLLLDIGAAPGVLTTAAALRGSVVAVEPDPLAIEKMQVCLRNAGVQDRVKLIPKAAALWDGYALLWGAGTSLASTSLQIGSRIRVETFDIGKYIVAMDPKPDAVSMDVGGEEETLFPVVGQLLRHLGIPLLITIYLPHKLLDPEWSKWKATAIDTSGPDQRRPFMRYLLTIPRKQ